MRERLIDFIRFLDRSPTAYHAARQITDQLAQADFTPLNEKDRWILERNKGYFITRDDGAVCAFRIPKGDIKKTTILASHLDSPGLKLKPNPDIADLFQAQFSVELYGSPILHTWLDRDIGLAGRISIQNENGLIENHLVFLDDYPMIIPSLSLHLNRSVAEKGLVINPQDHLNPIYSINIPKNASLSVEILLRKHLSFEKLLSFDLFLVPLQKASFLGMHGDFISSARLDNLSSAFASLTGIIEAMPPPHTLSLAIFWDHEEIGSKSTSGAESLWVNQVLERICINEKIDREDFFRIKSNSYCVSVDLAHGFHPNYSERFDIPNAAYLGKGVVLKTNGMQRYATNASSASPIIQLCQEKEWPLQKTAFRADIPAGSTVGSIMAAVMGISTVDIGIAGWAMHSCRETIATQDEEALCELLKSVLEKDIAIPSV